MRLELLSRHIRAGGVELSGAVQTADAWQPGVLDTLGEWLDLGGKLGDRVQVGVLHDSLELVAVRILLLQLLEGVDEPLGRWGL